MRAWVQVQGGSTTASATTGSGSQNPVDHQGDGIQKMNTMNRDRATRDMGTGGQGGGGSSVQNVREAANQIGNLGSTRGTGGTPARTGGSKNQIPM